jgi:hypothetical protein
MVASLLLGLAAAALAAGAGTGTGLVNGGSSLGPPPWLVVLFAAADGSAIAAVR